MVSSVTKMQSPEHLEANKILLDGFSHQLPVVFSSKTFCYSTVNANPKLPRALQHNILAKDMTKNGNASKIRVQSKQILTDS